MLPYALGVRYGVCCAHPVHPAARQRHGCSRASRVGITCEHSAARSRPRPSGAVSGGGGRGRMCSTRPPTSTRRIAGAAGAPPGKGWVWVWVWVCVWVWVWAGAGVWAGLRVDYRLGIVAAPRAGPGRPRPRDATVARLAPGRRKRQHRRLWLGADEGTASRHGGPSSPGAPLKRGEQLRARGCSPRRPRRRFQPAAAAP